MLQNKTIDKNQSINIIFIIFLTRLFLRNATCRISRLVIKAPPRQANRISH